jgi:hypothetical protein
MQNSRTFSFAALKRQPLGGRRSQIGVNLLTATQESKMEILGETGGHQLVRRFRELIEER